MIPTGSQAPDFSLFASPSQKVTLSNFKKQNVVLAFYPADWSPVCSNQIALYNEMETYFGNLNAQVLGISVDSKWSHMAFAEQNHFHFPLLADFEPKGEVSRLYGSYNESTGESHRSLYVIDGDGVIRWSYLSPVEINPGADGILNALEKINNRKPIYQ